MKTKRHALLLSAALSLSLPTLPASASASPTPLSLDQAISQALAQNPQILTARKEISRTLGLIVEARAQALPNASVGASYQEQDNALIEGASFFARVPQSWRLDAQVRQLLFSGGQVSSAIKIARLTRDNSWFDFVETVGSVVESVRRQYFGAILARELITVEEESIALLEKELEDQKSRFAAGTVPHFNVLRAEVELANAKPRLIAARNNFRIAQLQLARTLGAPLDTRSDSPDKPLYTFTTPMKAEPFKLSMQEAQILAKQRRALLKSRRQNILIAAEAVKAERGGFFPRIAAAGGYEMRSSSGSSGWDEGLEGWFAGIEGRWNIFDGAATAGKVSQARASLAKAKIAYEDAVRQVDIEVQEAYSKLQQAAELMASQTKTVEQAREALRLAQARFAAGAGTQLEVFDARVALNNSQVIELQARYEYIAAVAGIERVTGLAFQYDSGFDDPLMRSGWIKKLLAREAAAAKSDEPAPAQR